LAALVLKLFPPTLSVREIESRARELGMVYRTEVVPYREVVASPPAKEMVIVVIPAGFSSEDVAQALKLGGIIGDEKAFETRARQRNVSQLFRAGVYRLEKGLSVDAVIDRLLKGP